MPSASDMYVTQTFVDVGDIMTIPVKDHLIITPAKFYSLADQGALK
jgi:DNA repair protein RadC